MRTQSFTGSANAPIQTRSTICDAKASMQTRSSAGNVNALMRTHPSAGSANASTQDDGRTAAKNSRLALTTLCLAVLVAQLDTGVVYLATRAIGNDLKAGVNALQWIVDSYNLVYAVLLLTGGLLADLYGRRRTFMTGAAVFTAASLLCMAAPSASVLVAGRAFAGLGAALLIPASLAIIRVVWRDPAERGRALGIWAACNGLAMAIGPTLGGFLIGHFGWRSIFLVVVPVSLAAVLLASLSIPESSDPQGRHFDGLAQLLGATALGGLAFASIQSRSAPGWAMAAFLVAIAALTLFIQVEASKGPAALVPPDIFRARTFRGAATATAGMTFGMYGALFLLPLAWLSSDRFTALGAGIALIPMALVFVVVSPFSGALTERYGARATAAGGVATIGTGLVLIGISAGDSSLVLAEAGLMLTGLGMGFATGPLMGTAVGAVAAARAGTASALINVARMVGATIGVAILGAVFAMAGGGASGLRAAMLLGGAIQAGCASLAWMDMRPEKRQ
ncbi:EmrB/QacA subfamily drug resistance transporter OS=Castellaniella defragrans OX=75697 GN=HNR28_000004 PE=3 SV=1 [Castellaniella defragrans]